MWFRSTTSLANPSGLDGRLQRLATELGGISPQARLGVFC